MALICGAALIHPFCFVLTEKILADRQHPVSIELLCSVMGLSGVVVYGIWQIVYTAPRWELLVIDEIEEHQGSIFLISIGYLALVMVNLVHTMCFFHYILKLGSVSVSVMKGFQASLLFVCSHLIFCGAKHPSQCWTHTKTESMLVTFTGVILYGTGGVNKGWRDIGVCYELSCCVSNAWKRMTGMPADSARNGRWYHRVESTDEFCRDLQAAGDKAARRQQDHGEEKGGTWLEMVPLTAGLHVPTLARAPTPTPTPTPTYQPTKRFASSIMSRPDSSPSGSADSVASSGGSTPLKRHSGRHTPVQPFPLLAPPARFSYESIPEVSASPHREWQWHGGSQDARGWSTSAGSASAGTAAGGSGGTSGGGESVAQTARAQRSHQARMRAEAAGLCILLDEPDEEEEEQEDAEGKLKQRNPRKVKQERVFPWESVKTAADITAPESARNEEGSDSDKGMHSLSEYARR